MANSDIAAQVIENVRGDRETIHRIAQVILSEDPKALQKIFSEVGGVEVDERTAKSLIADSRLVSAARWT